MIGPGFDKNWSLLEIGRPKFQECIKTWQVSTKYLNLRTFTSKGTNQMYLRHRWIWFPRLAPRLRPRAKEEAAPLSQQGPRPVPQAPVRWLFLMLIWSEAADSDYRYISVALGTVSWNWDRIAPLLWCLGAILDCHRLGRTTPLSITWSRFPSYRNICPNHRGCISKGSKFKITF